MDGFNWSGSLCIAGIRAVDLASNNRAIGVGYPEVYEGNPSELVVSCDLTLGGRFEIRCTERDISFRFVDIPDLMRPALALTWDDGAPVPFREIGRQSLNAFTRILIHCLLRCRTLREFRRKNKS